MGNLATYGLAALMGLALGPILGLPQWWVLRRHVERASWWVPANALAWACGMVVVFIGAGTVPAEGVSLSLIVILIATLAAAGAVVGAIHGLALMWLLKLHHQVAP